MVELTELVNHLGTPSNVIIQRWDNITRTDLCVPLAVTVILNDDGDIAVHQRAPHIHRGSHLDNACGVITVTDENPTAAAIRETREEFCIRIHNPQLIHRYVVVNPPGRDRHRTLFLAHSNGPLTVTNPTEVQWARFVPLQQLHDWQRTDRYPFVPQFFHDLNTVLPHHPAHAHNPIHPTV
jgi:8-oxo-dGTP pyrophosphatase MutT (NUDIX family)